MLTLTLKNIPPDLHARLKASAERNRRSLNSEILVRLEGALAAPPVDRERSARELAAFVAALPAVDHARVARHRRHGRA